MGDLAAGLTVAVIALPLAMALGIASIPVDVAAQSAVSPPSAGLVTAVVAGFLISLLGGSRVQIGGPTGAFIVVVYGVCLRHGYAGLVTATALAGVLLILLAVARVGRFIQFVPYPVTAGFTTGIAVIIAASQLRDFFGLDLRDASGKMETLPAEFIEKLSVLGRYFHTLDVSTVSVALGTLLALVWMRHRMPRAPYYLIAVVLASISVVLFGLDVETVGSRFGAIPRTLPLPALPDFSLALVREVFPDAVTIALLCAVESLLSAVVADGMTGYRHKSDCELLGQGVANVASALFAGLPATGAIARTAANVKSGGTTPIAGMLHAFLLLGFMLAAAPLAAQIPLAALSAVLLLVAWNMSQLDHFRSLLSAPRSDVLVLLVTFFLTVVVDLTVAVGTGMVLASFLFMKRMADTAEVKGLVGNGEEGDEDWGLPQLRNIPEGVEVYQINGPFFFGCADRLKDVLGAVAKTPRVFILRMRNVPTIDATGMHALSELVDKCQRGGTRLVITGLQPQPKRALEGAGLIKRIGASNIFSTTEEALNAFRA
ncbi:MAG: SulP family inorganic anion transporter [Bdellovibrionota bacterium]|nr:MAG: SulP family inorganic anion transporter [Bdellovibrionota bacterium]